MEGEGKTTYRISDMPKEEKPRERLINLGARALSKMSCWRFCCAPGCRVRMCSSWLSAF